VRQLHGAQHDQEVVEIHLFSELQSFAKLKLTIEPASR